MDSAEKPRMVKTRHLKAPSKHPGHIRKIAHNRFQEVHILLIHLEKKLVFKNRGFFSRIHTYRGQPITKILMGCRGFFSRFF
jgi:hypothetical protein